MNRPLLRYRPHGRARLTKGSINLWGGPNLCEYGRVMVDYPEGVGYRCGAEADIRAILDRHVLRGERVPRLMVTPDPSRLHR